MYLSNWHETECLFLVGNENNFSIVLAGTTACGKKILIITAFITTVILLLLLNINIVNQSTVLM